MDVLVLHNMTFSSIHASFKQLHCRLNVLGSKAIDSFWDILQKYELKGSQNTVSDCSIGKESTSEWEEINPNTGKTYHKGEMQTSPLITKCIMKNKHFLLFVNNWTDYIRYFCFTSLLFCNRRERHKIHSLCKTPSFLQHLFPTHHPNIFTQCHDLENSQATILFRAWSTAHLSQRKVILLLHCTIKSLPVTAENRPVYLEPQHSVLLNPRSIMEILTSINRPLRVREKMPCGWSTVLKVKTLWIKVRPYSHFSVGQLKENQSIYYLFWKQ